MSLFFANTAQLKKYCPVKSSFISSNASYQKQPFELISHQAAIPVLVSIFEEICSLKIDSPSLSLFRSLSYSFLELAKSKQKKKIIYQITLFYLLSLILQLFILLFLLLLSLILCSKTICMHSVRKQHRAHSVTCELSET